MTSANFSVTPEAQPSTRLRRDPRLQAAAARMALPVDASTLSIATLLDASHHAPALEAVLEFARSLGVPLDAQNIPADLARTGVVGRIGVPRDAGRTMLRQRGVVGATVGADPLAPVSRLWRGLQRRADVLIDMRRFLTLPGSDAARAGVDRDVLLFSQRITERATPRREGATSTNTADQWTRARHAAELAYRHALAEDRQLLLVLPVGRGTDAQRLFNDALDRQARQQRLAPPRTVKAGLLSALLTGEAGKGRLLAASVMSIDELTAMATEAVGDCGPWPVVSVGQRATFYDMPSESTGIAQPLPLLLVLATMLQREGRGDLAQQLQESVWLTLAALTRMRDELGMVFSPPTDAFLRGVLTNRGRMPISTSPVTASEVPTVQGLRLRIATELDAAAVRDRVNAALLTAGVVVASVRTLDLLDESRSAMLEVRLRSRLGEPVVPDAAAHALSQALIPSMRCVSLEPWSPGAAGDRVRARQPA